MPGIDAHQHFWKYDPVKDSWITPEMQAIRRDFMPEDLQPVLEKNGLEGSILVQSDQSKEHNDFMLQLAHDNDFIKAVVGWVDLQADDITGRLTSFQSFKKIKGFRHILQGEADRALMLQPAFKRGIQALGIFNYTYDILIYPDQLRYIPELVSAFPYQSFIVDHLAKPNIAKRELAEWKKEINAAAAYPNVCCKISGMVNEADWNHWSPEDFVPYLDTVVESFGASRILFGSDWPVCLPVATYDQVLRIVKQYFSSFSVNEQNQFFGENAKRIYNLN